MINAFCWVVILVDCIVKNPCPDADIPLSWPDKSDAENWCSPIPDRLAIWLLSQTSSWLNWQIPAQFESMVALFALVEDWNLTSFN